jgi:hypothetical protein
MTEALGSSDWKAFFTPVNIKRTIASALPFTFQNVCGVPLMFGYTTYFFSSASIEDPFLATLIQQILLLGGICTSFYLVDRVGRRSLVLWGGGYDGNYLYNRRRFRVPGDEHFDWCSYGSALFALGLRIRQLTSTHW